VAATASVYFDREYALWPLQMAKLFSHSELYVPFQWLSKVTGPAATFLSHSVCFTHGRHGYTLNVSHWTLNNKQQINLHFICYDSHILCRNIQKLSLTCKERGTLNARLPP
jgi:uncharacterized membrane protein YhfC